MTETKGAVSSTTVMRAVYDLARFDGGPTAEEVAHHLRVDEPEVMAHLVDLHKQRIMRDRHRKGRREWSPW